MSEKLTSERVWNMGAGDAMAALALAKATIEHIADVHSQNEEEKKAIIDSIHKKAEGHLKRIANEVHPSLADRLIAQLSNQSPRSDSF